ncbi:unnamed protein product [Onchocerca ochengi]|uniref:DUF3778 domain-containing protein n=1 Tax=Onchocerca ochengi TaxID=42157 RepID=A0A182EW54_ONCOC|nr:unnamed protein product [Onchocerca ochengi]
MSPLGLHGATNSFPSTLFAMISFLCNSCRQYIEILYFPDPLLLADSFPPFVLQELEVVVLSEITDNDNLENALVHTVRVMLLHRIAGTLNETPDIRLQFSMVFALTVSMDIITSKNKLFMIGLPDVASDTRFLVALLVRCAIGSSCLLCALISRALVIGFLIWKHYQLLEDIKSLLV